MFYDRIALVRNIKVAVTLKNGEDYDGIAISKALKTVNKSEYKNIIDKNTAYVYKKSIDARDRECIFFIYTVAFRVTEEFSSAVEKRTGIEFACVSEPSFNCCVNIDVPPVVAGFGPSGMFCALALAKAGLRPVVIERGSDVDTRTEKVNEYWKSGKLNKETNVQFGEGGAGTFSDGKLLTRISDKLCGYVLREFARHGAPEEILYLAKPHIGTDNLKKIVKSIRNEIINLGGKVMFDTRLESFNTDACGNVVSVEVDGGEKIECSALFLCIGHSARDTVKSLISNGTVIKPKPFSVGVRIEHLQKDIDEALYGKFAAVKALGASSYTLSRKFSGRAVYSFCMCPGGTVVASASDDGQIVTNGMSEYARDGKNANSAIAVSVDTSDYGGTVEGAIDFQERLERRAFEVAGGNSAAPIQLVGDFLSDKAQSEPSRIMPTYTGKTAIRKASDVFPSFITSSLAMGLRGFENEIKGFCVSDAVLTFPETRTSCPVRIERDNGFNALGYTNLFPCGEGAGYAGGITSAAVDGLKAALKFIKGE